MKLRLAFVGLVLLSTAAVAAQTLPAAPAIAPDQVAPVQEVVACGPTQTTATYSAGGSTCPIASKNLHGVLSTAAGCACGFCSRQFIDKQCLVIQGGYSISGYLTYRCEICPIEN